jgi:hypothetical protein
LKYFLENSETELWLSFAPLFHERIKMIASENNCGTESALAVKNTNMMRGTFYAAHREEVTD